MSRTSDTGRAHWAENVVVTGTGDFRNPAVLLLLLLVNA